MSFDSNYISKAQFTALSRHYKDVEDLLKTQSESNESANKFRFEFSSLLQKFRDTYEFQQRLQNKIQEMKLDEELSKKKEEVPLEIEEGEKKDHWQRVVVELQDNLTATNKELIKLTEERDKLKKIVKRFEPFISSREQAASIILEKQEYKKPEITVQSKVRLDDSHVELDKYKMELEEVKQQKLKGEEEMKKLNVKIKALTNELWKTSKEMSHLRWSVNEMEETAQITRKELAKKDEIILKDKAYQHIFQTDHRERLEMLENQLEQLKRDYRSRGRKLAKVLLQRDSLLFKEKTRDSVEISLNDTIADLVKVNSSLDRKVSELEVFISEEEMLKNNAKREIESLKKEIEEMKEKHEKRLEGFEKLVSDNDYLKTEVLKAERTAKHWKVDLVTAEEKRQVLLLELKESKRHIHRLQKEIKDVEKEKFLIIDGAKHLNEIISERHSVIRDYEIRCKKGETLISELKKKLKIHTQKWQEIYEDRSMFKKNYEERKAAHLMISSENVALNHYNDHLTDVVREKEIENRKVLKLKEDLKTEYKIVKENLKNKTLAVERDSQTIKILRQREKASVRIVAEQEKEIICYRKQVENLIEKRNILESKLAIKTKDIDDLEEKYVIKDRDLAIVKKDYLKALEDVKLLKNEIHQLNRKNKLMEEKVALFPQLRQEILQSQQLLLEEQIKTKVLIENQAKHQRWREKEIQGADYVDLLFKNQFLQQKNSKKEDQLEKTQTQLMEKDKLIEKLTELLKKQPGEQVAEKLFEYRKSTEKQKETIKVLTAQVNMYESLLSSHQDRLKREDNLYDIQSKGRA